MPTISIPSREEGQVEMRTLRDCQLAVSIYPTFGYDACGGGGVADVTGHGTGRLQLTFDPRSLSIPDVTWRTATFLGLPLPPWFRIDIESQSLSGWLEPGSGQVELDFVARFNFTTAVFGVILYKAPPLLVTTRLTTGAAKGRQLSGEGSAIDEDGYARLKFVADAPKTGDNPSDSVARLPKSFELVGVADVPKTGDVFFDSFLRLPADTLAVMSASFDY